MTSVINQTPQLNEEKFPFEKNLEKGLEKTIEGDELNGGSPIESTLNSRTPSETEMEPSNVPELTPDMSSPYDLGLERPNPLYGQAYAYDSEPERELDGSPPESTRLAASSSTNDLKEFVPGISPITRVKRRNSRPMSQLRDSFLFENSEGSSDFRLSIMSNYENRNGSRLSIISTASNLSIPERNRLSTTLTTQLPMLEIYRDSALKTKDLEIQMEYAKFIFDQLDTLRFGAYYTEDDYKYFDPEFNPCNDEAFKKLIEEGIFWIKRLFKKHHPDATYLIGTWYESGINGCSLNNSKAHGLFVTASKLGSAAAMFKMGMYHEKRKEYSKCLAYYKKACSRCDPTANYVS
jgi:TPR repeat protein